MPPHPLAVLVVEDNPDAAVTLARLLTLYGHTVVTARSCAEARKATDSFIPDAVVLDLGFPDGDGLDLGRQFRAQLPNRPLLVALTGFHHREQEALAAGFDHLFLKPAAPLALDALLRGHRVSRLTG